MIGGWGLFWSNDQGILTNRCFELVGGVQTTWPLPYKSIYGTYAKGKVVDNFSNWVNIKFINSKLFPDVILLLNFDMDYLERIYYVQFIEIKKNFHVFFFP